MRVDSGQDFSIDQYFLTKQEMKELAKKHQNVPNAEADGIDLEAAQAVLFVVDKPIWQASERLTVEEEEDVLFTLRERLYRYLLRSYPHPVRVRYAYTPDDPLTEDYRVISVQSTVTDIEKGSPFLRYVIGYGAGATELQIEGRITEGVEEKNTMGEFALRERHGGYPNGFMNPSVMKPAYCLKYAAERSIERLSKGLRAEIPAAQLVTEPLNTAHNSP